MAYDEKALLTAILRQLMKIGEAMGAAPEAAETIRESISEAVREAMVTSEVLRELVSETVSSTIKELVSETVRESISELITELVPTIAPSVEPIEYPQDVRHLESTAFAATDIEDLWEPSAGLSVQLKRYSISADAATRVGLLWGTSEFEAYFLAANGSVVVNLVGCNIKGPSGQKLRISSSAAANITAHASGKEVSEEV